jgi:hypothetical protein
MKEISLNDSLFQGTVSVEMSKEGWKPWRIPYEDLALYPPDGIGGKAENPAGVRLTGVSATQSVQLEISPSDQDKLIDCVVDGQLAQSGRVLAGETAVRFEGLASGEKTIELYLDQRHPVILTGLKIDEGATWEPYQVPRPRWVTYGSSISQCSEASSPAVTWPSLVARRHNLNLTCLGYGGHCMLEPMVARMIRDLPADYISCCVGINVYGQSALSPRTFKPAIIGLIQLIREKHPQKPFAVISPIYSPPRETTENKVGFTLQQMRSEIAEAVEMLRQRGDASLSYVDGLELFGAAYASYLPDQLHPDTEGYRILSERFSALVARPLWNLV